MLVDTATTETPPKSRPRKLSIPEHIREAIAARTVTLTIPRGEDGYWTLLRYLDGRGGFSIDDAVRRLPESERQPFIIYADALQRAGFIGHALGTLRILRSQVEAPRLTQAGKERVMATRQSYLWRGIKMLGFFTVDELIVAVSSPSLVITASFALRYVDELAAAGYLLSRTSERGTIYRMRPKMNTGPAAPQVLRARFVWDPNLGQIMSEATRIEEARP